MGLTLCMRKSVDVGRVGSYSSFNALRCALACEECLGEMPCTDAEIEEWAGKSVLSPLLAHSDCSGELSREECEGMLGRLNEIAQKWSEGYDLRKVLMVFITAIECLLSDDEGVAIEFC